MLSRDLFPFSTGWINHLASSKKGEGEGGEDKSTNQSSEEQKRTKRVPVQPNRPPQSRRNVQWQGNGVIAAAAPTQRHSEAV